MFSPFPCSWSLPRNKPVHNLAYHHFPQRTAKISAPVLSPRTTPVKAIMPIEELCLGEVNDFREIDRMLDEMDNPSADAKTKQILKTISIVNSNLDKNIKSIEDAPAAENSNVSNGDILKLLRLFANYSHNLENYIKEEIKPSSLSFSQY